MDLSGYSLVLKFHRSSIHPCGAEAAIHQYGYLNEVVAFDSQLNSLVANRLQAERRPEDGARKVAPSSITLHELARIGLVLHTPIPGIASRMSVLVRTTRIPFSVYVILSNL